MAIRFLSNETLDGNLTVSGNATFAGQVIASSSSSGDYVRMYGGSGTAQWDIYGNGENLRISENSSGGGYVDIDTMLNVDAGLTVTGNSTFTGSITVTTNANIDNNLTVSGDVGMATGHSSGKFAVMSSAVHGSYDFYNNGTSYFNGAVIVDAAFSQTGGTGSTFSGTVYATEFDLPSGGKLDWANGDARIIEGEVGGYSLSFEIYNGSSALERVMLLEKDKTVSVYGDSIVGAQSVTSSTTNYEYMLRVRGKNNYSDGTTWYGSYGQILLHADSNMTGGARRFLITNALGSNKFAIVRSVDANTDPVVVSTSSGIDSGTADFVINNSGLIGIGNTNPGFSLDVYSPTTNVVAQFESGDNQAWISVRDDGYSTYGALLGCDNDLGLEVILANNAATRRLVIKDGGNVGIGTDSPTAKLTIDNGSTAGGSLLTSSSSSYTAHFIGNTGTGSAGIYCDASNGDFIGSDYAFIGQTDDKWAEIRTYSSAEGIRFAPRDNIQFTINNTGLTNIYNNTAIGSSSTTEPQRLTVLKTESNGNGIWRFGTSGTTFTYTGHRFFSAITSTATSNGWYTIGNVADSCSVIIVIKTAAHSQATILASRGYGPSNVARVQVLSSTKNANGGYANITAVRISGGGIIDMQLTWSSGPNVSVSITYYGNGCDLPADLRLSISDTGTYPYNVTDTATFRSTAASARVAGELDIASQTHCGSNINMYSTSKIFFHATTNTGRYIGASSTNDLDIAADDDINYRSNFNRFFDGNTEFTRLSGSGDSWIANGSNGKLGIGTTSPIVPLSVHGQQKWFTTNVDGNELRGFFNPGGSGDDAEFSVYKADGATEGVVWRGTGNSYIRIDSTSLKFINFYYGINNVGQIVTGGTNVLYQSNSDYRLKENVTGMTGALDRVSQLKPSRYNFISHPETQVDGFMAHELQEVVPQAVSGQKDEMNEDGTPKYQGVDHSQIVPLLVGAIKELKAEIEELKKQIK